MSVYKRGEVWWVRFQHGGETIRRSARTGSKRVAEEYERELRGEAARLDRGGKPRRTFDELMARFVREHIPELAHDSARRYVASIKALQPHFAGQYLDRITSGKLTDFISERKRAGVMAGTIRRDLACLSSALQLGISWEWCDANPVKALDKRSIKPADGRTRYLSADEYDRLQAAALPYLRPLIAFAVATGLRLEEQLSLTWPQIDRRRREVHLPRTKNGTARTVPLRPEALDAIKVQKLGSKWVFAKEDGSRYGKLTRGLAGAAKRADIKDLRWHDLRRTCGSWLLQSGADIFTVSRWLGHKSVAVTERSYAFLRTEDLHRAAQKWSQEPGTEPVKTEVSP